MVAAIVILSAFLFFSICANIIFVKVIKKIFTSDSTAFGEFCKDKAYNDVYYPCKVLLVNIVPHKEDMSIIDLSEWKEKGIAMMTMYVKELIPQLEEAPPVPVPFYNVEVYEVMEGVWTWRPILQ